MIDRSYQSWGRYPRVTQKAANLHWRNDQIPLEGMAGKTYLPFGNGRSYGDVCLNDNGVVLDCRNLDRFISFDPGTGVLRCEAGVLLTEIIQLVIDKGWFLPVTPGTQFVTLGGAIANDVHGKNHDRAGTFGCHLRCFELLRSDGERIYCSADSQPDLFNATIGGLGLTGVITWAEIQLHPINNPYIEEETIRYYSLDQFFSLARESNQSHEHTVAWIDCLAKGKQLGRGLFTRANYSSDAGALAPVQPARRLNFFIDPPFTLVNGPTLKLFNNIYYRKQRSDRVSRIVHYQSFFYPLDAIYGWNKIYGAKGFFQYQCVVPSDHMEEAIREILIRIGNAGVGSFLAVLKLFGDRTSPGLLRLHARPEVALIHRRTHA
ncbi:MAG: FAD-binding oxidoreductase [Candidatus Thiodiazotropha sp.]